MKIQIKGKTRWSTEWEIKTCRLEEEQTALPGLPSHCHSNFSTLKECWGARDKPGSWPGGVHLTNEAGTWDTELWHLLAASGLAPSRHNEHWHHRVQLGTWIFAWLWGFSFLRSTKTRNLQYKDTWSPASLHVNKSWSYEAGTEILHY